MNRKCILYFCLAMTFAGCSLDEVVDTGDLCPPRIFVNYDGFIVNRNGVYSNAYGEALAEGQPKMRVSLDKYLVDDTGKFVNQAGKAVSTPVVWNATMIHYMYYKQDKHLQYLLLNYEDAQDYGAPESQICDRESNCAIKNFQTYILSDRCPNKYPTCALDSDNAFFCISESDNPHKIVCDGSWVNPKTNSRYCGASGDCRAEFSGEVCSTHQSCQDGKCVRTSSEICGANTHQNGVECEADSVEHCGSATNNCANIAGWKDGECVNASCAATACKEDEGYVLSGIQCVASCLPGQIKCGGRCVNPMTDNTYCGATGSVNSCEAPGETCKSGSKCENGACVLFCASSQTKCVVDDDEYCAYLNSDIENCTECGVRCSLDDFPNAESIACKNGCVLQQCQSGYHRYGNVCEADDKVNCGTHGNTCSIRVAGWVDGECSSGKCIPTECSEKEGYHLGENQCVADTSECCGSECVKCNDVQVCSHGVCSDLCTAPLSVCTGDKAYCANLSVELDNCEACGKKCSVELIPNAESVYCFNGCKVSKCKDGYHIYENQCEPDSQDNCGMHGVACDVENADNRCDKTTKQCSFVCKAGFHLYNGMCEADDIENCGNHGTNCDTGGWNTGKCTNRACVAETCDAGYHLDNNKQCVADTASCCGTKCSKCTAKQFCSAGACVSDCVEPLTTCTSMSFFGSTNYCANLNEDSSNCGMCGRTCSIFNASSTYCEAGECRASQCRSNYHLFNGACEQNDVNNCGDHGVQCNVANARNSCSTDGRCQFTCNDGYHEYGSACEKDDETNCGTHGASCKVDNATTYACSSKRCTFTCKSGYHIYDSNGAMSCEADAVANCGYHGNACSALSGWSNGTCNGGVCKATECAAGYCLLNNVCVSGANNSKACGTAGGTASCSICADKEYCSNGICEAKKCDGNVCQKTCVNTDTSCGTDCKNCNTAGEHATAGLCLSDGTCYTTACSAGYHAYNGQCEVDSDENCGAHGAACIPGRVEYATKVSCKDGVCAATECKHDVSYYYHVYNNVCEVDSESNCTTHGKTCSIADVENSKNVWCYYGICQATACKGNSTLTGEYATGKTCVKNL